MKHFIFLLALSVSCAISANELEFVPKHILEEIIKVYGDKKILNGNEVIKLIFPRGPRTREQFEDDGGYTIPPNPEGTVYFGVSAYSAEEYFKLNVISVSIFTSHKQLAFYHKFGHQTNKHAKKLYGWLNLNYCAPSNIVTVVFETDRALYVSTKTIFYRVACDEA